MNILVPIIIIFTTIFLSPVFAGDITKEHLNNFQQEVITGESGSVNETYNTEIVYIDDPYRSLRIDDEPETFRITRSMEQKWGKNSDFRGLAYLSYKGGSRFYIVEDANEPLTPSREDPYLPKCEFLGKLGQYREIFPNAFTCFFVSFRSTDSVLDNIRYSSEDGSSFYSASIYAILTSPPQFDGAYYRNKDDDYLLWNMSNYSGGEGTVTSFNLFLREQDFNDRQINRQLGYSSFYINNYIFK